MTIVNGTSGNKQPGSCFLGFSGRQTCLRELFCLLQLQWTGPGVSVGMLIACGTQKQIRFGLESHLSDHKPRRGNSGRANERRELGVTF
jgi:hypothetical protein